MNKRLAIISITTIALLLTSGVSYAVINKGTSKANVVATPEKQVTQVAEETTPTETTQVTATTVETAPVVEQVAPAPVYRSFDEIIMDYPNMIQGYNAIECSHIIEQSFPNRFTPEKREVNIKLISQNFINSCAAAFKGNDHGNDNYDMRQPVYLRDIDGTGDFWAKHGGL